MSFLRKLFGGRDKDEGYQDTQGIYFYVQCDHCGAKVRLRADKQYDLSRTDEGYTWYKTVVDNKCFRPMSTVVRLDRNYEVVESEIEGGHYISKEAYEAPEAPEPAPEEPAAEPPQQEEP
jgi:hypothetical protein